VYLYAVILSHYSDSDMMYDDLLYFTLSKTISLLFLCKAGSQLQYPVKTEISIE
jgi:hypothetical protein